MNGRAALFEATDVVAGYLPGVDILNGCSLTVADGEMIGVIGPNGAGKSTLVKAMFGLVPLRRGTISLRGEDTTRKPPHELVKRGVAYVPQRNNVFPSLTVEDNLRMGCYLHPDTYREREAAMLEVLPRLGDKLEQRAGLLSGGEKQMLAIARALMPEPSVLMLDEPSAGLSPIMQDDVFDGIVAVNRTGVSVLMVEQNARRCLEISDRAYVLDQGRNAYTGTGEELLADPKVIELYLGTLARARK
jgi:branched-chain amino acid transport system ATP-binding protein